MAEVIGQNTEQAAQVSIQFKPSAATHTRGILTALLGDKPIHVDAVDLSRDRARETFVEAIVSKFQGLEGQKQHLADSLLGLTHRQVQAEAAADEGSSDTIQATDEANSPVAKSKELLAKTAPADIQAAKELLQNPDLLAVMCDHVHQRGVAGEDNLILAVYLIGVSRLLDRPLAGLITSASSTGKSYVAEMVSGLFPDEVLLMAHRMTARALERMPGGSLIHRFVVCGERSQLQDEAGAEATRALREMLSGGRLRLAAATPVGEGDWETRIIEQPGPIAYLESTTQNPTQIFDEDRNRCLILSADESRQQTTEVIAKHAQRAVNPPDQSALEGIVSLHHTAQRLLETLPVVVPFADRIAPAFPSDRIEARRAFGHFLSLVRAVALLHQYQRGRDAQGRLVASEIDYEIVRNLFLEPLSRSLGRSMTSGGLQIFQALQSFARPFTIQDAATAAGCVYNTARGRIFELQNAGQIEVFEQGGGSRPTKYVIAQAPPPLHGLQLPPLTELPAAG